MTDPDYIAVDLAGIRFNQKYPPNKKVYGDNYGGYKNNAEEVLFYDFAVQFYDVSFKYKGKSFYLLTDDDHVAVCDSHFSKEYETFSNAVELIECYQIDGKPLLELIEQIEEVEPEWFSLTASLCRPTNTSSKRWSVEILLNSTDHYLISISRINYRNEAI